MIRLLVGVAPLMLGGCLYYSSTVGNDGGAGARTLAEMQAADRGTTPEDVRLQLADRTGRHVFGGSSRIYYTAADGCAFLWLPDEQRVFAGEWRIDTKPYQQANRRDGNGGTAQVTAVCLRFPGEAVHPVMRQESGDSWYCPSAGGFLYMIRESLAGDVFGLAARREVPFVLSRYGGTTLADLQARLPRR